MEERPGLMDRSSVYNYNVRLEQLAREYQVAVETQLIIGEKLSECARTEGVNQHINCKDLKLKYLELSNDRFHGMIFPSDVDVGNRKRILSSKK